MNVLVPLFDFKVKFQMLILMGEWLGGNHATIHSFALILVLILHTRLWVEDCIVISL